MDCVAYDNKPCSIDLIEVTLPVKDSCIAFQVLSIKYIINLIYNEGLCFLQPPFLLPAPPINLKKIGNGQICLTLH